MNETRTHLDIFSGIGGFAIAAKGAGFRTVAFCESDSRCREFLGKAWGLPVELDIRELDGRKYRGVALLTGGPPCQPASRAGKQGGASDDRWLWGEALRVLNEAQPACVVFENPPGILDVGLDGILSEMGRIGYETQCFDIPACAVDSPQLRHRIWIVGFRISDSARLGCQEIGTEPDATRRDGAGENSFNMAHAQRKGREPASQRDSKPNEPRQQTSRRENVDGCREHMADPPRNIERGIRETAGTDSKRVGQSDQQDCGDMADSERERLELGSKQSAAQQARNRGPGFAGDSKTDWSKSIWVPCADGKLRRAPDDSFDLVDGLHRSLLAALGNSIVPQVAFEILKAIPK